MSPQSHQPITKHLASPKDPRAGNALQHQLQDMLVIAICASIWGADTWGDVETWGIAKAMVGAWATANHLVLGQVKVRSKSNEITAIPELLRW